MSGKVRSNLFVKFNTLVPQSTALTPTAGKTSLYIGRSEYWINLRAPWVISALSFIGGVHIGARALHVLIRYGLVVSLPYSSGEEGIISSFIWFLPAFPRVEEGEGVEILQPEQGHPEGEDVL
jgi:hypothetical protein